MKYFEGALTSFAFANVNSKMGSEYYYSPSLQERYNDKLTLYDGTQFKDPSVVKREWTDDITKLPKICWLDVTKQLIGTPSAYTKGAVTVCRSLDGYGFFRECLVQDCYYHYTTSKSFWFIMSQVYLLFST